MVGVIPLVNSDSHRGKRGDEGERREEEEEETGRWRTDDSRVEKRERLYQLHKHLLNLTAATACTVNASLRFSFAKTYILFFIKSLQLCKHKT